MYAFGAGFQQLATQKVEVYLQLVPNISLKPVVFEQKKDFLHVYVFLCTPKPSTSVYAMQRVKICDTDRGFG